MDLLIDHYSALWSLPWVLIFPGQQGNLAVTIDTYKPDVECQPAMSMYPDIDDCKALLSMMPTSYDDQIFGQKGDRGVEVGLPFDLVGRMWDPLGKIVH